MDFTHPKFCYPFHHFPIAVSRGSLFSLPYFPTPLLLPSFHPPKLLCKSVAAVCVLCREKMRPKMYFLRASHKSPQMFLAGYFIGASDRWSW